MNASPNRAATALTVLRTDPATYSPVPATHIPGALASIRTRHGLSTRRAARLAGVSNATISRAQRGRPVDALTAIALSAFIRAWWWKEPA